jgi:hypothetical protein
MVRSRRASRSRPRVVRSLALAAGLALTVGACSSTGAWSVGSTTTPAPAAPAAAAGTAPAGGGSTATGPAGLTPAAGSTKGAVPAGSLAQAPDETIEQYLQRIGLPEAFSQCYATALARLGIADLHQLQANQSLAAKASAQFESCAKANPVTTTR